MGKTFVIPDVHLKPWMFDKATKIIKEEKPDEIVCLMDIPDDWKMEHDIDLYVMTYERLLQFQKEFPHTIWCMGNHDAGYQYHLKESGSFLMPVKTVKKYAKQFEEALPDPKQLCIIHRIDDVIFLHAGLYEDFVRTFVDEKDYDNIDFVIEKINSLSPNAMWCTDSPIWARPLWENEELYQPDKLLQVVGHTPVDRITKKNSIISCDTFSTDRYKRPIGTREFLLIDTKTQEFRGIFFAS